jgi:hypothetical protein
MTIDELRTTIRQQGDAYHDALLRHGTEFRGRVPAATVPNVAKWLAQNPAQLGHCYRNAQFICLAGVPGAKYYEGYWASGRGSAVHHAWVVFGGTVLDPTAEESARVMEGFGVVAADPACDVYVGIPIPNEFLRERLHRTGAWLPVSAEYLRTPHPLGNTLVA